MARPKGSGVTPLANRFWSKVDRRGPTECWPWKAMTDPRGYGRINAGGRGKPLLAHRVSWALAFGPPPNDLHVCHHCDNPPCVNPRHLFLGDDRANMRDCSSKGRIKVPRLSGEQHPRAKLTERLVTEIRSMRRQCSAVAVAKQYGVCENTIRAVWRGITWTHSRT